MSDPFVDMDVKHWCRKQAETVDPRTKQTAVGAQRRSAGWSKKDTEPADFRQLPS